MDITSWLVPQEKKFFTMLQEQSSLLLDGATALKDLTDTGTKIEKKVAEITKIEEMGDKCVHDIIYALNTTFITPIDREDIHHLTTVMDDVLDYSHGAAERIELYKIKEIPQRMRELTNILLTSVEAVHEAINNLEDFEKTKKCCIEINKLENDADHAFKKALAELFESKDFIYILKMKEIYEQLETATDKCEDVADIISGIVVKHG